MEATPELTLRQQCGDLREHELRLLGADLELVEAAPGVSVDELREKTGCPFR